MNTAFVSGAGSGLGAAIARKLAQACYRVVVFDLDGENAERIADELPEAIACQGDVTDERAVERGLDLLGQAPDLAVCNAGILRTGPLMEQSLADFLLVLNVNLSGVFVAARAAARRMQSARCGSIITISSINGIHPSTNCGAYAAAKGGVITLTQQMALEWGSLGLRVNCIAPGFIDAGMSTQFYQDQRIRDLRSGATPLGRLGSADDIARAVLFLGSDDASYITGQTIAVDGGVINSVLLQLPRA